MQSQQQVEPAPACEPHLEQVWSEWKALVQALRHALESRASESQFRQLVGDCMAFYRTTYTVPPSTIGLLESISGQNSTLLEAAFMWLGGWRPSSAITLAYSKMGISVGQANGFVDLISQSNVLSKTQLAALKVLQEQTRVSESEISSNLASLQMLVADQNMAEAIGVGAPLTRRRSINQAQRLMDNKLTSLRSLYLQANGLRLQTLQELQNLLTPVQAAQCIIAAFELGYAMRKLGSTSACKSGLQLL